jgi:hypothetical protein
MSLLNPAYTVARQSVVGAEGLWAKMFDPPRLGPPTPDYVDLARLPPGVRANPVPEVMQAAGYVVTPVAPHTVSRSLMHGVTLPTWDRAQAGRPTQLTFFLFADDALTPPFNNPQYPAPTLRVPRGAVYHAEVGCQGPPPHTIHWHGIEPTPMNDGVGHCSFEVEGKYVYQWQPNFIGTYFYHCHRNTQQHFEFGLFGIMPFMPPDAYFSSIAQTNPNGTVVLNNTPIGAGRDGKFRTAANLAAFPQFPGFIGGDPVNGVATADPLGQYRYDPHAFTVPYDVEVIWVVDDRDSNWSTLAPDPFTSFPVFGSIPGVNDNFHANGGHGAPGPGSFFAFNDFNADYWFITGVPVPAPVGGSAQIPAGITLDPHLNSGVSGTQVSVHVGKGQTGFVRCLCAAYNNARVTFPVDVVIIEWDGRALGVPPFGRYNRPILVKARTPFTISTARRFGAVFNSKTAVNSFATVEFLDTRGNDVLMTALIPFVIS